jgi:hypothetical protein
MKYQLEKEIPFSDKLNKFLQDINSSESSFENFITCTKIPIYSEYNSIKLFQTNAKKFLNQSINPEDTMNMRPRI